MFSGSYTNVHPAAEARPAVSAPRGAAEASGAAAEAAAGGPGPDGEDEEPPGGE